MKKIQDLMAQILKTEDPKLRGELLQAAPSGHARADQDDAQDGGDEDGHVQAAVRMTMPRRQSARVRRRIA